MEMWRRLGVRGREPVGAVEDRGQDVMEKDELIEAVRNLNDRDRLLIALRFGADLDLGAVGDAIGLSGDSAGEALRRELAGVWLGLEVAGGGAAPRTTGRGFSRGPDRAVIRARVAPRVRALRAPQPPPRGE